MADPSSALVSGGRGTFNPTEKLSSNTCEVAGLGNLNLESRGFRQQPFVAKDTSCFGDNKEAFVVVKARGEGQLIGLGNAGVLTNEFLDSADNAVLATWLLQPDKDTQIAFVSDLSTLAGDQTLSDLVDPKFKWALGQLALAVVVYALWKVRRFGGPVLEPQIVELPGSLMVRASGELHRRAGSYSLASIRLSSDLERRLRLHYRLSPDSNSEDIIKRLTEDGLSADLARRAVDGQPAIDRQSLTNHVKDIDQINTTILRGAPTKEQRVLISATKEAKSA